jgi:hypothetical protein
MIDAQENSRNFICQRLIAFLNIRKEVHLLKAGVLPNQRKDRNVRAKASEERRSFAIFLPDLATLKHIDEALGINFDVFEHCSTPTARRRFEERRIGWSCKPLLYF